MLNTANTGKHSYPNIEVIKRVMKSPNKVAYSTSTHCSKKKKKKKKKKKIYYDR